jgi:hypothetical protein
VNEDEMGRASSTHILVEKSEGQRPHRRPRYRWENNIRMDHRETRVGRCTMDASGSA